MTATLYKLKLPDRGASSDLPSLEELCDTLKRHYTKLDEVDRNFFALIYRVMKAGPKAKIETVIECRAIAWSMVNRCGVG
jgi:hypothetical protein